MRSIAAGSSSSAAAGRQVSSSVKLTELEHGSPHAVYSAVFLPDGRLCVSCDGGLQVFVVDTADIGEGMCRNVLISIGRRARPRMLAANSSRLFFTAKPDDVNEDAERSYGDYPSTRVLSIELSNLASESRMIFGRAPEVTELQWCALDDVTDADDEDWGEADLQAVGSPIAVAADDAVVVVLHRQVLTGARPWEYRDEEYEHSMHEASMAQAASQHRGARTKQTAVKNRNLPKRQHALTMFSSGSTRQYACVELGEEPIHKAPCDLIINKGQCYLNCVTTIRVFDYEGHPRFTVPLQLEHLPRHARLNGLALWHVRNDRIYGGDLCLHVFDAHGAPLQPGLPVDFPPSSGEGSRILKLACVAICANESTLCLIQAQQRSDGGSLHMHFFSFCE